VSHFFAISPEITEDLGFRGCHTWDEGEREKRSGAGRELRWKGEILRRVAPQNDRENGR